MEKFENSTSTSLDDETEYIPPVLYIPNVIDVEITPQCEFNCPGCWGTKPDGYSRELSNRQWIELFERWDDIADDWTDRVVITGGEPLRRKNLHEITSWLKKSGRDITLSTTGLDRYRQLPKILDDLMSIGIPVDGPNGEINSLWRSHPQIRDSGLEVAVNALRFVQKNKPNLKTAVRTLVHPGNIDYVHEIPRYLEEQGLDISRMRWILYELNRREVSLGNYSIPIQKLISSKAIANYKDGETGFHESIESTGKDFQETIIRSLGDLANRYFIISPYGETRAVVAPITEEGNYIEEFEYGNMYTDFEGTIELLNQDIKNLGLLSESAADSPAYFYSQF